MPRYGTAEALGWLDHFKPFYQHVAERSPDGLVHNATKARGRGEGGKRAILGFSTDHNRPPAGSRRQFKVASCCSLFDIAELLHFTDGDWEWLSLSTGVKRTRCEWNSIYEAARF